MPGQEFYSEEEAQKILRMANETSAAGNVVSRDEMLRAALEAGIPAAAIEAAEEKIRAEAASVGDREAYKEHIEHRLRTTTAGMLGLAALLIGINLLTGIHNFWAIWPVGITFAGWLKELIEIKFGQPWKDPQKVQEWRERKQDDLS